MYVYTSVRWNELNGKRRGEKREEREKKNAEAGERELKRVYVSGDSRKESPIIISFLRQLPAIPSTPRPRTRIIF